MKLSIITATYNRPEQFQAIALLMARQNLMRDEAASLWLEASLIELAHCHHLTFVLFVSLRFFERQRHKKRVSLHLNYELQPLIHTQELNLHRLFTRQLYY
ncbi:MAG: hypothetical protein SAK29_16775, partial [Scytonema sp. PMC 1069.18]|nr:hypothetical protein [Scytonema sp. PMC 1069.18]